MFMQGRAEFRASGRYMKEQWTTMPENLEWQRREQENQGDGPREALKEIREILLIVLGLGRN